AAVLLGCWAAGLTVDPRGDGGADVAFLGPAPPATRPRADETYALALDPLGMPFRPGPPPGTQDFSIEIRSYGDRLPAIATERGQVALADGTLLADRATTARPRPGPAATRILIDADTYSDPVTWLVAPLMSGASVVLCRHLDPARLESRLATERAVRFP